MHGGNHRFGAAVAVGIAGINRFFSLQENVVNTPGVDREALDGVEALQGLFDALLDMADQAFNVPGQMAVQGFHPVREAINLFGFQFAVFHPAHDVAAGGGPDIHCEIVFHKNRNPFHPG